MSDSNGQQGFINKVIKAASENPEFRTMFLADPKKVLEDKLNIKLPEDFEIVVHQDTAAKLNITLPYHSEELTDVELSAVSGGVCWAEFASCMCT
jgi:hypothetical protein